MENYLLIIMYIISFTEKTQCINDGKINLVCYNNAQQFNVNK